MEKVKREDIVDYVTYEDHREEFRKKVLGIKNARRIHLGDHLTFLFENTETMRYQIQEMVRTERIVKESDILHEISTYNELLGDRGSLGCTLLIEIIDPEKRDELLRKWLALPKHLYVILENGQRSYAKFDERQVGEDRVSSVQYLKFNCHDQKPISIGCDHEELTVTANLSENQKNALWEDISRG